MCKNRGFSGAALLAANGGKKTAGPVVSNDQWLHALIPTNARRGEASMSQTDEILITAAVQGYVLAMSTAAEEGLRAAFHPHASIVGNFEGAVEWLSVDAYVGEVLGAGLPPSHSPNWTVVSLDITDDAATVKVEDEFGSTKFTDYLALLKIAGEWKIISKLYHLHN